MQIKKLILTGAIVISAPIVFSQSVAINTTGAIANPSAMLDIESTTKGLLIPRVALTATNNNAPVGATVTTSLLVYNTATSSAGTTAVTPGYYYWDGTQWVRFITGALPGPAWMVTGNAGTNPAIHFAGTTDAQDFAVRTNNVERMRVTTAGRLGVGTSTPGYTLDLNTGTFAFGNSNVRTESRDNAGLQGNAGAQSGFFETASPTNYPAGASSWWHLIDVRHSNNGNNYALQISGSFFDQELWFRKTNNNPAQAWSRLLTSTSGWMTTGNAGTNAAINFIGTTDGVDFVTRTNNTEKMRVTTGGSVGIGINAPTQLLDVQGGNARVNNIFVGDVGHGAGWGGFSHANQNTTNGYAVLESSDGAYTLINKLNTGNGYIGFRVSNTDMAVILNNGNMGVGTTGPICKIHAYGDGDNIPVIYGQNINSSAGTTSFGVRGECGSTGLGSAGVSGVSTNSSQNEIGVVGDYSLWGASIFGLAWAAAYTDMPSSRDFGVFGTVNYYTGTGVYGRNSNASGTAYGVYSFGNFAATGAKAASVPTTKGNQLLYCVESPEMWFEDIGNSKLINGEATVMLDGLFMETVQIDAEHPMQVFIQENGESNGVYVIKEKDRFIVKEKNGGHSNIEFSYRVLGKRRFYEDHRFGVDANQPFGDNLKDAKYHEPTTTDPEEMKRKVDQWTKEKEDLMRQQQQNNQK